MSARPLAPGMSLRGYRILSRLGMGGDGEVWLVEDARGQQVALKARAQENPVEEQRFRQEFERLRTLRLPSVVRVLDVGADQGHVFFTMDVARGEPFDRHVQRGADLTEKVLRAATAGAGVARALSGVHRLGLTHRDIKPANILVDEDGRVTVLDFGTARFGPSGDTSSEFMGTVAYMAPEQRIGLGHDQRVDLYALGVTLHEALSGVPAGKWKVARPRASLALLGAAVPLALAELVDRMLSLDPADRPGAEECESLLDAVARGAPVPPGAWPSPLAYVGDASLLLADSVVVTGRPGSGRGRLIEEARYLWYRKGYRSISARCTPDRPFGAIRSVLAELFVEPDPVARRALAGADAPLLATIWPELPVPVQQAELWPPDPVAVGNALRRVLARKGHLAVILWDLDQADVGSAAVIQVLLAERPPSLVVWATARRPTAGLRQVLPPAWTPAAEREALPTILPPGRWPETRLGDSPLLACARAWRMLASDREEKGPELSPVPELVALAVLEEPFPAAVANRLAPDLDRLLRQGWLLIHETPGQAAPRDAARPEVTETTATLSGTRWLGFADAGTRRIARSDISAEHHAAAAQAWQRCPSLPEAPLHAIRHALRAGTVQREHFLAAIRFELDRGNPGEVERWVHAAELHLGDDADFLFAFARLYANLELRPAAVRDLDLLEVDRRARSPEEQGLSAWLLLIHEARQGNRARAIAAGVRQAKALMSAQPMAASQLLREVALARLAAGEISAAVDDCRQALALARRTPSMNQAEVNAATTLSAGLIYLGRLREVATFCSETAERCREHGFYRGQGALLANLGVSRLYLGDRDGAAEALAACRAIQPRHRDPLVHAVASLTQARLAIEVGDLAGGRPLLDEAMTAGTALQMKRQLAEGWALALEVAVHLADPAEASRALSRYGTEVPPSDLDHWPAVQARWYWLTGDLDRALSCLDRVRKGHAAAAMEAEKARLLLISGRNAEARKVAEALVERARQDDMREIVTFAQLVAGAAASLSDAEYEPLVRSTRKSRWVHLYLGALHLDAIRRQLRGENVSPIVRQLRLRARDVGHRLYEALGREDGW